MTGCTGAEDPLPSPGEVSSYTGLTSSSLAGSLGASSPPVVSLGSPVGAGESAANIGEPGKVGVVGSVGAGWLKSGAPTTVTVGPPLRVDTLPELVCWILRSPGTPPALPSLSKMTPPAATVLPE